MNKMTDVCAVTLALCLFVLGCLPGRQVFASPEAAFPPSVLQSLADLDEQEPAARALKIMGWKTRAGAKVLYIQTTALPMFGIHVSFSAGSAHDAGQPGLAATTFSLLNEGVSGKDLSAIMETFDSLGARLGMNIDEDRASLSLRSLSAVEKSEPALDLFIQLLSQPLLAEDALVRVKNELVEKLKSQQQSPTAQLVHAWKELLAAGHAYAQPVFGTETGLAGITRQQVQAFHQRAYSESNVQITLVGNLSKEQAMAISLKIAHALPTGTAIAPATPVTRKLETARSRHMERSLSQTHLRLTQPGVARDHPDYIALSVANWIFAGNNTTSRLIKELRAKRGLVYGVDMTSHDWPGGGPTTLSLQTSPQFSQGTLVLVQSMFRDYLRDGPTQQELDDVKRLIRGRSALGSASNAQILLRLVEINRHNLPLDLDFNSEQIQRLTVDRIKAALNRHYDADRWAVVTVGPTTDQQPLPPVDEIPRSMCRADAGFVAS